MHTCERIHGYLAYMYKQAGVQAWRAAFEKGNLPPEQAAFFLPKPAEALFDLQTDRDEVKNLLSAGQTRDGSRLSQALFAHSIQSGDLGFLPECEMHALAGDRPPIVLASDKTAYPVEVCVLATHSSNQRRDANVFSTQGLTFATAASRYWAVRGVMSSGRELFNQHHEQLIKLLADPSPCVRIVAAEALGRFGDEGDRFAAYPVLIDCANPRRMALPPRFLH